MKDKHESKELVGMRAEVACCDDTSNVSPAEIKNLAKRAGMGGAVDTDSEKRGSTFTDAEHKKMVQWVYDELCEAKIKDYYTRAAELYNEMTNEMNIENSLCLLYLSLAQQSVVSEFLS